MTTTPISSIPHRGGTINLTNRVGLTNVYLGNGKYMSLYTQSSPDLLYAYITRISGYNGGSPTSTNSTQYAFASSGGGVRAWRLNDTRVMAWVGQDIVVLEVGENDAITVEATLTGFYSGSLYRGYNGYDDTTTMNFGAGITGIGYDDVTAYVVKRTPTFGFNNTNAAGIFRMVYNPTNKTVTATFINSLAGSSPFSSVTANNIGNAYYVNLSKIPGENAIMVTGVNGPTTTTTTTLRSAAALRVYWCFKLTHSTGAISQITVSGLPSAANAIATNPMVTNVCAMGNNNYVGLADARSYLFGNGTSWASNYATFATTGQYCVVTSSVCINENYIAFTFTDPVLPTGLARTAYNYAAQKQYLRIVRVLNSNFAEIPPSMEDYEDYELGYPLNPENTSNYLELIGPNTLAFHSKSSATATDASIQIRTIFGA